MGQKVSPVVFRLPVTRDWRSRWFADKKTFAKFLISDRKIRDFIKSQWRRSIVSKIEIVLIPNCNVVGGNNKQKINFT